MAKSKYQMVREFHEAFAYNNSDAPTPMDREMTLNRVGFIVEELIEFLHATAGNNDSFLEMYEEFLDRAESSYQKQLKKEYPDDVLIGQVDACIDIEYFNNGNFAVLGVDPDEPFRIVHAANMGKLFPDGKPHYNEFGKIMKPDGWVAPEPLLEAEVKRQMTL